MTRQPWPDAAAMLRLQLTHGADARTVRNVLEAFRAAWRGPIATVRTVDEAFRVVGL